MSIFFAIFLIPAILTLKHSTKKNKYAGLWKNDEMTADSFEVFYAFGAESGEATRKLSKLHNNPGDMGLINYVSLLNLWKCYKDVKQIHNSMIFGYPPDSQRIVNAYIACEFELKNNKDLSTEAKKELQEQIDSLKDTYNTFLKKQDTKGGFLYKIAAVFGRNTLEKAAKKAPSLREQVLEPLMKKRDSGAFK